MFVLSPPYNNAKIIASRSLYLIFYSENQVLEIIYIYTYTYIYIYSTTTRCCEDIAGAEISCTVALGEPRFKANDIVTILGYGNTKRVVQTNVDDEDKKQFKD